MIDEVSYDDLVLHDFGIRKSARFLHMGHWDDPDATTQPSATELIAAQARMDEIVLSLLDIRDGQDVLDVGCGFGGSLETLDSRHAALNLVGVNLSGTQLEYASELTASEQNRLHWIRADGCCLPLSSVSFDRVLCLEALPHFQSRDRFFAEVARVLRPGGILALADIIVDPDSAGSVGMSRDQLAQRMQRHFGPWPEPFAFLDEVDRIAGIHGLEVLERLDATRETSPTHMVAFADDPKSTSGYSDLLESVRLVQALHESGALTYSYTKYVASDGNARPSETTRS